MTHDDQAAAYWFRAAATQNDPLGMIALGLMHAAGRGVAQDWAAATRWWKRAAEGNRQPIATRLLGDAYACGLGVKRSDPRAVRAFRAAAQAGDSTASVHLGHMYANGCAGPDDKVAFEA